MEALTANDGSTLWAVHCALVEYDGFIPHGSAQWCAIRRLERMGYVRRDGYGVCCDCPDESHVAEVFALTDKGEKWNE